MKIESRCQTLLLTTLLCTGLTFHITHSEAQLAPSPVEVSKYTGLHRAAHFGDVSLLSEFIGSGALLEEKDPFGRTALHIAAYGSHDLAVEILADAGADMNALENQLYDIVTIAAVANDYSLLDIALKKGASAKNITSPYDGTALIAAAHLGHYQVIARLTEAGAPLDHINNLGWTALIEAVVLGDGGPDHVKTVKILVEAGADKYISDGQNQTPLDLARAHGYSQIIVLLQD